MHVSKRKKNTTKIEHKCREVKIDKWEVKKRIDGETINTEDKYLGKVNIKEIEEYEYFGDIVLSNGSNTNKTRGL